MPFSSDTFEAEFEDAIRWLASKMPTADKLSKPTLLHTIRVGIWLYTHGYDRETTLAGLLHDAIEDSPITTDEINKRYGKDVAILVEANTKNDQLQDHDAKYEDLLRRCIEAGERAAIIKAADILDNYRYFSKTKESARIQLMEETGATLVRMLPVDFDDAIFGELRKTIS